MSRAIVTVRAMSVVEDALDRHITFEGCFNFRDAGGYAAPGGRVRWRRLFRADGLSRLTVADLARAQELTLATVIDLRTSDEVSERGRIDHPSLGVAYHHLPMIDVLPDRSEIIRLFSPVDVAARYVEMLLGGQDALAETLAILTDPTAYPAVLHCTAGKDRTGIAIAMLLGVLGVADELIADDYALSRPGMVRMLDWLRVEYPDAADTLAEAGPALLSADADAMALFCGYVRDEFGSFNGWAATIGMASAVPHIRAALLSTSA